jgi:hypothetical protein
MEHEAQLKHYDECSGYESTSQDQVAKRNLNNLTAGYQGWPLMKQFGMATVFSTKGNTSATVRTVYVTRNSTSDYAAVPKLFAQC